MPQIVHPRVHSNLLVLIDPSFQQFNNRLFVWSFNDGNVRDSYKQYYLLTVEIKGYVMTDGRNFYDQPITIV